MIDSLKILKHNLKGELHWSSKMKSLYATDGSIYRELPLAVAMPMDDTDIKNLILFAIQNRLSLIPRTAGTSLAGQCVGNGIVVDTSKYLNKILKINVNEAWAIVQPGVIRDELNHYLKPYGLMFGPNTSTSNRAMIGGMVGNNSCGSTSIVYGTTRDHTIEIKGLLSDGSTFHTKPLTLTEYEKKCELVSLEGSIYRQLDHFLKNPKIRTNIYNEYPKSSINRRNTGYAVDVLLETEPFTENGDSINLSKLLCGSEGTLAFTTEIKVNLVAVPPKYDAIVCAHFHSIHHAMEATVEVMKHKPFACELMDRNILECTYGTPAFAHLRSFVIGDPAAILIIELRAENDEVVDQMAENIIKILKTLQTANAYPVLKGNEANKAWSLRAAGLGLLANLPGDEAINCIEDTAVDVQDLPAYIHEFEKMMHGFGQEPVYYAHAGDGELHLKPRINLSQSSGIELFKQICYASAKLVKKFKGSLSGEHGDGRVRAAFIPMMIGSENYKMICDIKNTWDPTNIFNPGKIVEAKPIEEDLRHQVVKNNVHLDTIFNFGGSEGFFKAAEKCTGSGDCRKLPFAGGTMCPSYQATLDEQNSTRGRANALREFLSQKPDGKGIDHSELEEVMDLCIQCKGCTSECPSNVDMSRMKSEFLFQIQKIKGRSFRSYLFANNDRINNFLTPFAGVYNFVLNDSLVAGLLKKIWGISPKRTIPELKSTSLRKWFKTYKQAVNQNLSHGRVVFFCDEFTNIYDVEIGVKTIKLLNHFGFEVLVPDHVASGRSQISKGFLKTAKKLANKNVTLLSSSSLSKLPVIGLEPSAILTLRDEYPDLVDERLRDQAISLKDNVFLIEEFLYNQLQNGLIDTKNWLSYPEKILYHGHCHQKALSDFGKAAFILSAAQGAKVETIPSGCCGMAGSFGYEKEHYDVSMKIGNLVLFPEIMRQRETTKIAASGTSCRHQIKDGTGKIAVHPIEIIYDYAIGQKNA